MNCHCRWLLRFQNVCRSLFTSRQSAVMQHTPAECLSVQFSSVCVETASASQLEDTVPTLPQLRPPQTHLRCQLQALGSFLCASDKLVMNQGSHSPLTGFDWFAHVTHIDSKHICQLCKRYYKECRWRSACCKIWQEVLSALQNLHG